MWWWREGESGGNYVMMKMKISGENTAPDHTHIHTHTHTPRREAAGRGEIGRDHLPLPPLTTPNQKHWQHFHGIDIHVRICGTVLCLGVEMCWKALWCTVVVVCCTVLCWGVVMCCKALWCQLVARCSLSFPPFPPVSSPPFLAVLYPYYLLPSPLTYQSFPPTSPLPSQILLPYPCPPLQVLLVFFFGVLGYS